MNPEVGYSIREQWPNKETGHVNELLRNVTKWLPLCVDLSANVFVYLFLFLFVNWVYNYLDLVPMSEILLFVRIIFTLGRGL